MPITWCNTWIRANVNARNRHQSGAARGDGYKSRAHLVFFLLLLLFCSSVVFRTRYITCSPSVSHFGEGLTSSTDGFCNTNTSPTAQNARVVLLSNTSQTFVKGDSGEIADQASKWIGDIDASASDPRVEFPTPRARSGEESSSGQVTGGGPGAT